MEQEFAGKVALVTGSSGIGLGAALRLANGGAKVFVCGIDDAHNQAAEEAASGLNMTISKVDVSDEAQVSNGLRTSARLRAGSIFLSTLPPSRPMATSPPLTAHTGTR